ncbi:MAG: HAD family hydrolase [Candidatus Sedimenticola sp. 1PA]
MANLEVLLFDVDGTIADTEKDGHRVAFNEAFAEAGLDWNWSVELYGKLLAVTGGKERIRYYLQNFNTEFQLPSDGDAYIASLHKMKTAHYTRMMAEGQIPLRPGIRRLLEESRAAGIRLAIATTTTPENVTALLGSGLGEGWESWFEVIAAGDIVPQKKPAPDIYTWAMEKMGVSPAVCAALEDSYNGIRSVNDADIPTVVITVNGYTENEEFPDASLIVDQLGEPGAPCAVLSGNSHGHTYVNLDLIRTLHAG